MHVPMSLWARTATQGESQPTHVPMSPLGEGRYVGEGSRKIQNSLEVSRRFPRFLEVFGRMLPEDSGRNGFLYIGVDGTLPA